MIHAQKRLFGREKKSNSNSTISLYLFSHLIALPRYWLSLGTYSESSDMDLEASKNNQDIPNSNIERFYTVFFDSASMTLVRISGSDNKWMDGGIYIHQHCQ